MRLLMYAVLALALAAPAAPAPPSRGVIPIQDVGCKHEKVSADGQETAKNNFAHWSASGWRIWPNRMQTFSDNGTSWYVCNCKGAWFDPVPLGELNEVEAVLERMCGEHVSGWVWSKKWQKGYNLVTTDYIDRIPDKKRLCPRGCFGFFNPW